LQTREREKKREGRERGSVPILLKTPEEEGEGVGILYYSLRLAVLGRERKKGRRSPKRILKGRGGKEEV